MSDSFRLDGIEAFEKSMKDFFEVASRDVQEHVKALAYTITYNLVMQSPQYSGAAASAWRIGIGSPEYITDKPAYAVPAGPKNLSGAQTDNPYSMRKRNMNAVNDVLALAGAEIGSYTLPAGDVYITNGLDYALWFETGQSDSGKALRIQNMPHRTVAQVVGDSLGSSAILRF